MYNLHLSAEQIEFRDMLRVFAANEIRPAAIHPDRLEAFDKPLMTELLDQASELGLRTLTLSEEAGGVGVDTLTSCIVFEELAAGDVDIAVTLGQTALVGGLLFDKWMTADQRARFLPRFLDDISCHLAYAGIDADAQSGWRYRQDLPDDPGAGPTAVKQGDDWVIDGALDHVSNGPIAELFVVPVADGALIVPKDAPGLGIQDLSGNRWHHGSMARIDFKSCAVPAGNMLDTRFNAADFARLNVIQLAAINLGVGRAALETAIDYAKIRRQGGADIVEHQAVGKMIADMTIKLELARTMIWKAAWVADYDVSEIPLHIVASTFTAEAVHDVTHLAAECFGAMAVMRDMPLQKYVQDGFIFLNSDSNNMATKLRVAEAVVRN